jgi:hypothetical protein
MKLLRFPIAAFALSLMFLALPPLGAQTATQGGVAQASLGKTAFTSPMILETEFAAADKMLWGPPKGRLPGDWFTTDEYHDLGRFSCEGVYLRRHFNKKKGTWEPGLEMSVRDLGGGMIKVKVRAYADNPDDNKDRKVSILFELFNGNKLLASASDSSGVEEDDTQDLSVGFTLPAADLVTDPMTKLRMTVQAPRD